MLRVDSLSTPLIGPVSLEIGAGECCCLSGPSGAGKSLLLRAIADLDPSDGRVALDGEGREAMPAPEWRRRVAFVPATAGWWAPGVAAHFPPSADMAALLEAVGLPDALAWEVARLSTGERQRLALARALVAAPRALLLDEPTAALDPEATERVEQVIRRSAGRGMAILMVTHDAAQAARLGDQRLRLTGGRLEAVA